MLRVAVCLLALTLMSCGGVESPLVKVTVKKVFMDAGKEVIQMGSGTGFFVSKDGLVMTAAHVVTDTDVIKIYVEGQKEPLLAYPLVVDTKADLALLKVFGVDVKEPMKFCQRNNVKKSLTAWAWRGYGVEWTRGPLISAPPDGEWLAEIMVGPGFSGGPVIDEELDCVEGITVRGSLDAMNPLALFMRPETSPRIMRLLRDRAPEAVEGL
jgi:S1-C subfamily serine protease